MHILLIHQAFAAMDEPGGTRHHEFARLLVEKGHRISIIASPVSYLTGSKDSEKKTRSEQDGKITIYRTSTYSALHKSFFHRIISFVSFMVSSFFQSLRIRSVDVVWGTSPPIFQCITAWLIARIKGAKFILEVRDLWPAFAVAVGVLKNKIVISLSQWLERFLYRRADQVIVNSPGYIQHVKKRGAKHVSMVPNGADASFFKVNETSKLRKRLGWSDTFILLYAGAHGMSNDLQTVLAAAELIKARKDIRIVLLGDGKEKHNLMQEAKTRTLTNVQFLDPVSKNKIADYLNAADACLAILKPIALYKTTYPNKVFDYMAAGKPIVLAIDGVIREVVEDARCGYFCQPGDIREIAGCIQKMCDLNADTRRTMGQNGRQYLLTHFDRRATVDQFSDIMEKIVKNYG